MKIFSGKYLRNNQGFSWSTFLEQTALGHGQVGDGGCVLLSLPALLASASSPGAVAVGSRGAHGARLCPEVPHAPVVGTAAGGCSVPFCPARCCSCKLPPPRASPRPGKGRLLPTSLSSQGWGLLLGAGSWGFLRLPLVPLRGHSLPHDPPGEAEPGVGEIGRAHV